MIIERDEDGKKFVTANNYDINVLCRIKMSMTGRLFSNSIYKLFYMSKHHKKHCRITKKYFEDDRYIVMFSEKTKVEGFANIYKFVCPKELSNLDYYDWQTMYILSLYEPKRLFQPFCRCETFYDNHGTIVTKGYSINETKIS